MLSNHTLIFKTAKHTPMPQYDIIDSIARENADYLDAEHVAYGDEQVYILEVRDE